MLFGLFSMLSSFYQLDIHSGAFVALFSNSMIKGLQKLGIENWTSLDQVTIIGRASYSVCFPCSPASTD